MKWRVRKRTQLGATRRKCFETPKLQTSKEEDHEWEDVSIQELANAEIQEIVESQVKPVQNVTAICPTVADVEVKKMSETPKLSILPIIRMEESKLDNRIFKANQKFEPIQNLKNIINFEDQILTFKMRGKMALDTIVELIERSSKWEWRGGNM